MSSGSSFSSVSASSILPSRMTIWPRRTYETVSEDVCGTYDNLWPIWLTSKWSLIWSMVSVTANIPPELYAQRTFESACWTSSERQSAGAGWQACCIRRWIVWLWYSICKSCATSRANHLAMLLHKWALHQDIMLGLLSSENIHLRWTKNLTLLSDTCQAITHHTTRVLLATNSNMHHVQPLNSIQWSAVWW